MVSGTCRRAIVREAISSRVGLFWVLREPDVVEEGDWAVEPLAAGAAAYWGGVEA